MPKGCGGSFVRLAHMEVVSAPPSSLATRRICLVGAGNMGGALANGLLRRGLPAAQMTVVESDASRREFWSGRGVATFSPESDFLVDAELAILAVKPTQLASATAGIATRSDVTKVTWLSIAAGISCNSLGDWLATTSSQPAESIAVIRAMPNTPALVGVGATALFANAATSAASRQLAEEVMGAVGLAVWVGSEIDIDAVTALSGSGPAYFFFFLEHMVASATKLGLDQELARQLAVETAAGAAELARRNPNLVRLREQVTSPGGTTAAALAAFSDAGLHHALESGMQAAYQRARELANEQGDT